MKYIIIYLDLIHIMLLHNMNYVWTIAEYTFLKANVTFNKIDHILGHKKSLDTFERIEIIYLL